MRSTIRLWFLIAAALALAAGCPTPTPIPSGIGVVAQTGASPNDAILIESPQKTTLVVAASLDSSVQFFDFTDPAVWIREKANDTIFFAPNSKGISPNPWSMAATQDGKYLVVSLFDDHSIALIDLSTRRVIARAEPMKEGVAPIRAMHPTSIAVKGNQVLVVFTNLLSWAFLSGAASQYGPAVVVRFVLSNGALEWMESLALSCVNPSDITIDEHNHPIVTCSGSMRFDDGANMQLETGAGVAVLEPVSEEANDLGVLKVAAYMPLSKFSPSRVIVSNDGLFMTSSVKRQLLFVANNKFAEEHLQVIPLDSEKPDDPGYLPSFVKWNDSLAFVADFRNDRIFAVDLSTRTLNPAPFESPVQLQNESQPKIYKGPQTLLRRHGSRNSTFPASDIFVVTTMSNEVFSIRLDGLAAL